MYNDDMRTINEHEQAFQVIMSGQSCFVTGGGGVGKTHLLKTVVNAFTRKGKQVMVVAPTGAAAVLIQGATIHRAFGIPSGACINEKTMTIMVRTKEALRDADVVIIDEISMCRMDLFDSVCASLAKAEEKSGKHKQLIVFGDFFQLPPVLTENRGERKLLERYYNRPVGNAYAFQADSWQRMNFYPIVLTEVIRQGDAATVAQLKKARVGNTACIWYFNAYSSSRGFLDGIYLTGKKEEAERRNREELARVIGASKDYPITIEGTVEASDLVIPSTLSLKVGALVTTTVNHPDGYYVNGSIGRIDSLEDEYVRIKFPSISTPISVGKYTWKVYNYTTDEKNNIVKEEIGSYEQLPLRLAYASTIHKSQGSTYDEINLDPECWAPGQLYVALSRMRDIRKLYLTQNITPKFLIADPVVSDFYEHLLQPMPKMKKTVGRPPKETGSTIVKRIPEEMAEEIDRVISQWQAMGSNRYNYEIGLFPTGYHDTIDLFIERITNGTGSAMYINDPDELVTAKKSQN